MPGNSPYEAVDAFLKPLQRAISCLGSAKISTSPRGKHQPEMLHGWTLNDGAGMAVQTRDGGGRLGVFKASMHYEIVLSDDRHEGKWRVSTRGYAYELVGAGDQKTWSMHWHPVGRSGITSPHFHLPPYGEHQHLRSSRHTLEAAVQWCIEMGGAAVDGWEQVLAETEGVHKLWRSWSDDRQPDEIAP